MGAKQILKFLKIKKIQIKTVRICTVCKLNKDKFKERRLLKAHYTVEATLEYEI